MRLFKVMMVAALVASMGAMAYAELQNVEVGGALRIRGNYYEMDSMGSDSFFEQRTKLNVKADFTDDVSAFIEFDSYDVWGEDFRSVNYVTGLDGRAASGDDVEVYQAYVEANEMYGYPVRLRVGRQEMKFGSGWLVGTNESSSIFSGLSFDAIRLDYATDMFSATAFAAKLAENFGNFGEDDADMYGIYLSYLGVEDMTIDAYWFLLYDDGAVLPVKSNLHTVGLRGAGVYGAFDYEAEVAYQFGSLSETDLDWDAFAANAEAGYTFDMNFMPRVFLGAAWFEGGEDDDMPFNRLFSEWEYTEFISNTDMSNMFIFRAGVSATPTESVSLSLVASYFMADEENEGGFWFWSWEADDEEGLELGLYADYQYTEDLVFRAGYAHFFADDAADDGNFVLGNGLLPYAADDDDNYHYAFVETELKF